jgi:hypothetical protein
MPVSGVRTSWANAASAASTMLEEAAGAALKLALKLALEPTLDPVFALGLGAVFDWGPDLTF